MSVDFDKIIVRDGTASVKQDGRAGYFGTSDILPLWVADMDFPAPEGPTNAIVWPRCTVNVMSVTAGEEAD